MDPDLDERGLFERPDSPGRAYAVGAGLFLIVLGVLSLIFDDVSFSAIGRVSAQPQFLIWSVSGWTTILWIAMGGLGLVSAERLHSARSYALFAAVVFGIVAVWGFIDGNDVVDLLAADTSNNVTHAVLAGLGLLCGLMTLAPRPPAEPPKPAPDRPPAHTGSPFPQH